jgi:hypothetical protein
MGLSETDTDCDLDRAQSPGFCTSMTQTSLC